MKYLIVNQAEGESVDIHINDFIGDWFDYYWGFGVTSRQFIEDLQRLPDSVKNVRLHISTPGGDVVAANHIANTINDQQNKGRMFESLVTAAFSAGTIITSATKTTKIADNGLMMIHDPWTVVVGNARDLRKAAADSDKFRDSIIAVYKRKSQLSDERLAELMAEETYMNADEAIANGFADAQIPSVAMMAAFDISQATKLPTVPDKYRARVQNLFGISEVPTAAATPPAVLPEPAPVPQPAGAGDPPPDPVPDADALRAEGEVRARSILAACTKAGVPEAAADFLDRGLTAAVVEARLADAPSIRVRCAAAKLPERANSYIKAGMTVKEVADDLFDVLIARQSPEINNALAPEVERRVPVKTNTLSAIEIYAQRNHRQ